VSTDEKIPREFFRLFSAPFNLFPQAGDGQSARLLHIFISGASPGCNSPTYSVYKDQNSTARHGNVRFFQGARSGSRSVRPVAAVSFAEASNKSAPFANVPSTVSELYSIDTTSLAVKLNWACVVLLLHK